MQCLLLEFAKVWKEMMNHNCVVQWSLERFMFTFVDKETYENEKA